MIEIKFRAWDKDNKKWLDLRSLAIDPDNGQLLGANDPDSFYVFSQCNYELIQYTGLKDKNGKEICTGDIIKYDEDESINHWVSGQIAKIISLPGRFTARLTPYDRFNGSNQNTLNEDFQDSVTIIGNIYENPELLYEE